MLPQRIADILKTIKVSVEDPRFYSRVFIMASKARKQDFLKVGDNLQRVCAEEFEELSRRLDRSEIQESCQVRNILRTRRLANLLINDKGGLKVKMLPRVIRHLKKYMYSLGPNRQYDGPRNEQILEVLTLLNENPKLVQKLRLISKPYRHKFADQIIRDTLDLPAKTVITDAHARRAVLSAWMCYLRQNVGSCFATAPAIIVHDEQPELFLSDIQQLMGTGQLKRTFAGVEHSVPLSPSWGAGDLKRRFLVPREAAQGKSDLWLSPGLVAAFEAVGLLDENMSLKQEIKTSKQLIVNALSTFSIDQPYLVITPEGIIRHVLLAHFELTAEDIEEYENRPHGMITSGFMMPPPSTTVGGKGKQCADFIAQFEVAKNAFKALADNALLKSWEFSLASFAETKAQFTRWNLYASLGMAPDDKGGIGQCLFEIIKRKLEEVNKQVEDYQIEYEQIYSLIKMLERRIRNAASEREAQWIRMDYQSRSNEFRTIQELRDRAHFKARRFANLFNMLVDLYYDYFPRYFQEIYDADIIDVSAGAYDDSPAGFRLLYKYGRSNTSQWTRIYHPSEYIDSLVNFFTATERELVTLPEFKGLEEDLSQIVTAVVNHVRREEVLETAL